MPHCLNVAGSHEDGNLDLLLSQSRHLPCSGSVGFATLQEVADRVDSNLRDFHNLVEAICDMYPEQVQRAHLDLEGLKTACSSGHNDEAHLDQTRRATSGGYRPHHTWSLPFCNNVNQHERPSLVYHAFESGNKGASTRLHASSCVKLVIRNSFHSTGLQYGGEVA